MLGLLLPRTWGSVLNGPAWLVMINPEKKTK